MEGQGLRLWFWIPLSTIFQLYRDGQFYSILMEETEVPVHAEFFFLPWFNFVLHSLCHSHWQNSQLYFFLLQFEICHQKWFVLIVVLVKLLNIHVYSYFQSSINLIGGVMFGVLASSDLDHRIESWLGQTKYNKTGFGCFPANHTALRNKSKDWLARNEDNVSEWSNMSTHGLLF